MELNIGYVKTPSGILKVIEIILVIVCMGILFGGPAFFSVANVEAANLGVGSLVSAIIVTPLLLITYITGRTELQKSIFEIAFNVFMFLFLLSAGSVAVNDFREFKGLSGIFESSVDKSLALGAMCIVTSFVYLGDAVIGVMAFKKE